MLANKPRFMMLNAVMQVSSIRSFLLGFLVQKKTCFKRSFRRKAQIFSANFPTAPMQPMMR